jgi:hypothetical protein
VSRSLKKLDRELREAREVAMNVQRRYMTGIVAVVLAGLLLAPAVVWGQGQDKEVWGQGPDRPEGTEIVFDLVIARPLGVVGLALGTSIFLVSYPFAVVTGSAKSTAHALVAEPYTFTFERGLGIY